MTQADLIPRVDAPVYVHRQYVVGVVVTYLPSPEHLAALLDALSTQVDAIVVVDNGSPGDLSPCLAATGGIAQLLLLGENLGIATAQNRGIEQARQLGAEFVLLMDQDSMPAPRMVAALIMALRAKETEGFAVAAVGPRLFDAGRRGWQPFMRITGLVMCRYECQDANEVMEVSDLISSGSLIPMTTLEQVGVMEEVLFIDYVDTEWILRAKRLGYHAFGVCSAEMRHCLGDSVKRLFGRTVTLRSPLRHYFMFRNAVWLYRQAWVPWSWKVADILRLTQRFVFYTIFARPRARQLPMMLRGMMDGWRSRMGRFSGV